MDLATAMMPLLLRRPICDEQAAIWPGLIAPIIVPAAAIAEPLRREWIISSPLVPLATRVRIALEAGWDDRAWALATRGQGSLLEEPGLLAVLEDWAGRRRGGLALPSPVSGLITVGTSPNENARRSLVAGVEDTRELVGSLGWPRWAGPLVCILDGRQLDRLAQDQPFLARPAMPMVRIEATDDPALLRTRMAAACTRLAIELLAPPQPGWPPWIVLGIPLVAEARARGQGPSPREMLVRRRQAGIAALRRLMTQRVAEGCDPALAMACCAPLCHSLRRHRLPAFLELLRQGTQAEAAIRIAYGLNLADLLDRA